MRVLLVSLLAVWIGLAGLTYLFDEPEEERWTWCELLFCGPWLWISSAILLVWTLAIRMTNGLLNGLTGLLARRGKP